jgi:Flp pilus assembly CpaF family ATPase
LVERKAQLAPSGRVISPAITIRHLLKAALRNRPDRIVLGEMRGGEAYDLLGALNSGHAGSISTIHANSPLEALSKLLMLALQAPDIGAISERAIMAQIGSLIDLVVQLERHGGCRRVAHIEEIERFDYATGEYVTRRVYRAL